MAMNPIPVHSYADALAWLPGLDVCQEAASKAVYNGLVQHYGNIEEIIASVSIEENANFGALAGYAANRVSLDWERTGAVLTGEWLDVMMHVKSIEQWKAKFRTKFAVPQPLIDACKSKMDVKLVLWWLLDGDLKAPRPVRT